MDRADIAREALLDLSAVIQGAKLDIRQGRDPLPRLDRATGVINRGVDRLDRRECAVTHRHGRAL